MTDRERTLTVSSLHREWGEAHRRGHSAVPSIRLNGKWLAALGIMPGQKIRVVTNGATIILAPLSFDGEIRRYGK
jgi:Toxin SymE, type I toxin-antitoxin system